MCRLDLYCEQGYPELHKVEKLSLTLACLHPFCVLLLSCELMRTLSPAPDAVTTSYNGGLQLGVIVRRNAFFLKWVWSEHYIVTKEMKAQGHCTNVSTQCGLISQLCGLNLFSF